MPSRMVSRTVLAGAVMAGISSCFSGLAWASNWANPLNSGSTSQSQAGPLPDPPASATAVCASATDSRITVSWTGVSRATSYKVWSSTTSASSGFTVAASGVAATSWTSSRLSSGNYWFQVSTVVGSNWGGRNSTATGESSVVRGLSCVQP